MRACASTRANSIAAGTSYTIDTARALRAEFGPEAALCLIIGADQFLNLPTWREWRALFDLVNLAVAGRPGYEMNQEYWPAEIVGACASRLVLPSKTAPTKAFGAVHLIDMAPAEISATGLRAWLAQRGGSGRGGPQENIHESAEGGDNAACRGFGLY